ncbi:MAG TPA: hypothetical protein VK668_22440 [Mucilaginibacter sp.]|nr:hypothetical protein [Mucilaginibacter sp.]
MEIIFSPDALEQLQYWKKSGNKKIVEKIKTRGIKTQLDWLLVKAYNN